MIPKRNYHNDDKYNFKNRDNLEKQQQKLEDKCKELETEIKNLEKLRKAESDLLKRQELQNSIDNKTAELENFRKSCIFLK